MHGDILLCWTVTLAFIVPQKFAPHCLVQRLKFSLLVFNVQAQRLKPHMTLNKNYDDDLCFN